MADDVDLRELQDGSNDLARRDLRSARLSGLNLSNRDFSGAHLEGANLSESNLSGSILKGAQTRGMVAQGANLGKVQAHQTVFFGVNFIGANLVGSNFSRSHFTRSNFTRADLRGANFNKAVFNEGTTFEGCIVDETTDFDGVSILRPLARQEAFRFYRVERGLLVRRTEEETSPENRLETGLNETAQPMGIASSAGARDEIATIVDQLLSEIAILSPEDSEGSVPHGGMGHNNPPEPTPLDRQEVIEVVAVLHGVRSEIQISHPGRQNLESAADILAVRTKKILSWAGRKLELAADEFAKEIGKSLASKTVIVTAWLALSGSMGKLVELLASFASTLTH